MNWIKRYLIRRFVIPEVKKIAGQMKYEYEHWYEDDLQKEDFRMTAHGAELLSRRIEREAE